MIELAHVSKAYGKKQVLRDYSASIPDGVCTVIMGPSGRGKTTLLRLIMGLEEPDSGTIENVPERMAVVFQEDRLCEGFSAVENIMLVLQTKPEDKMAIEREVRGHLIRIGLCDSMEQPVSELSGGMRRRVAIARAMFADAPLVILDEPFKGLDVDTKRFVMEYVKEQIKGKTCLLVTHDEEDAKALGAVVERL